MYGDIAFSEWVLKNISEPFEFIAHGAKILSNITSWGQLWFIIMIGLIIYDFIKNKKINLYLILAFVPVGLGWLLADKGIKVWIGRERPYQEIPDFAVFAEHIGYEFPDSPSFPSGHTLFAFGFAFIITKYNKKLAPYVYTLAGLIAISRIIVGAHYLSDVIAGAAYGTLIGVLGGLFADFLNPKIQPKLDNLYPRKKEQK